jgi:hypothetical protein
MRGLLNLDVMARRVRATQLGQRSQSTDLAALNLSLTTTCITWVARTPAGHDSGANALTS